jgi:hypothetical protein
MDEYGRDTRFIAIQFVEIGGDHLDRIIDFEKKDPHHEGILEYLCGSDLLSYA